jgi:hypothetical protein
MWIRLRYAAVLLASLLAIYVGLWPSILTLGALLAAPLAVLSLVGLVYPRFLERRQLLRRFVAICGTVIATELIILVAWVAWTPRRPVQLIVQPSFPPRARIIYGVVDGAPRSWLRWERRFEVPPTGLVYSSYPADDGWYREANPHPVTALVVSERRRDSIPVRWIGGGKREAATCTLAYDEFAFGDMTPASRHAIASAESSGWLDSLPSLGVTCRGGRLYRVRNGDPASPELRRSGPACYYDRAGGMTCHEP